MTHRRSRLRLLAVTCAAAFVLMPAASALGGDPNAGDVWVDNQGQQSGPGHEMDPHLACHNINLWGAGLADSSGKYTIDGWPPSGSQEQVYGPSQWTYQSARVPLDVIDVQTLIDSAIAKGDTPQNGQGFHFKLQFSADPQKHKTFWVDCQPKADPSLTTNATSNTAGQPIHDVATLSGGDVPTGTITWNVYPAGSGCTSSLDTVSVPVNGDGIYNSPNFVPTGNGIYQWVATYSGDAHNNSFESSCTDANEQSVVQAAPAPGIALVKLERNGSSGSFVRGPITGNVGDTIEYQMTVVDTGNTSLVITFTDPHCDAGTLSAPVVTLPPGGEHQYTCSHVLRAGDAPSFTNTAFVSGQPPSGPPLTAMSSVVAIVNSPPASGGPPSGGLPPPPGVTAGKRAVKPIRILRCPAGKVKRHKKVHGRTLTVCVAKKHVRAVVRRRIPAPRFTG